MSCPGTSLNETELCDLVTHVVIAKRAIIIMREAPPDSNEKVERQRDADNRNAMASECNENLGGCNV